MPGWIDKIAGYLSAPLLYVADPARRIYWLYLLAALVLAAAVFFYRRPARPSLSAQGFRGVHRPSPDLRQPFRPARLLVLLSQCRGVRADPGAAGRSPHGCRVRRRHARRVCAGGSDLRTGVVHRPDDRDIAGDGSRALYRPLPPAQGPRPLGVPQGPPLGRSADADHGLSRASRGRSAHAQPDRALHRRRARRLPRRGRDGHRRYPCPRRERPSVRLVHLRVPSPAQPCLAGLSAHG